MAKSKRLRQAVVIVHGMGEQRPLDMLNRFIDAAIPGKTDVVPGSELPVYYSRPVSESDSYEARVYLARETSEYPQTEFYEYHWSHMMQGNKISDLWETFRRMLFTPIWAVPSGLRVVWVVFWAIIFLVLGLIISGKLNFGDSSIETLISMVIGGGATAAALTWVLTTFLPGKISTSFVDVVRYLDTSPRSYAVRKNIRNGMIDFLADLHKSNRYERIIIVAHSLGAYVAYDGISYLWTRMNQDHVGPSFDGEESTRKKKIDKNVIDALEAEAKLLLREPNRDPTTYHGLQRELWNAYRDAGNFWLITDFVTAGTPMYMADKLMTKNKSAFEVRVERREIAVCPPLPDLPGKSNKTVYSYPYEGGDVLYHAAPFSMVRWSNMWFPARFGFFGDWFGGPLRHLFGAGIRDHALNKNDWKRFLPAWAHTLYFTYPEDEREGSATRVLQDFMELKPDGWLKNRSMSERTQTKNRE